MLQKCEKRERLSQKVVEAIKAVYALRDQELDAKLSKDETLSLRLNQARTAQRIAERSLRDHTTEHGCGEAEGS